MARRVTGKGTRRIIQIARPAIQQQAKSSKRKKRDDPQSRARLAAREAAREAARAELDAKRKSAREMAAKLKSGTFLTRETATRVSSLSLRTLERAIVDGTLPAYRVRRRVLIKAEDLQRFVERVAV